MKAKFKIYLWATFKGILKFFSSRARKNTCKQFFFWLLFFSFYSLSSDCCQANEDEFIYDAQGKRDPFITLLDPDSPTGIRTNFTAPEKEVKLPEEFVINGILQKGQKFFAIINNRVKQEGDNLGNVRIKEINKDRVILTYEDREFTIFLRKEKKR